MDNLGDFASYGFSISPFFFSKSGRNGSSRNPITAQRKAGLFFVTKKSEEGHYSISDFTGCRSSL